MQTRDLPLEQFAALRNVAGVRHAFTTRVEGVDVTHDKATALQRLDAVHREVRDAIGVGEMPFITAEQVHGNQVQVVTATTADKCWPKCDGLVTGQPGICVGIYVADCCAVYLVDPVRHAIGVVHSGRKGTELAIVANAIRLMRNEFKSQPADLIVQLSPCIRPPHYEVDFAGAIIAQCRAAGVQQINDSGTCTACDLKRYYSYRAEKGRTGRMLALLALTNS